MAFLPTENTKSTLLDKAACVPAEVQFLLQDPMTHAGLKEPMVMKECKLTDQLILCLPVWERPLLRSIC